MALYAALLVILVVALLSDGTGPVPEPRYLDRAVAGLADRRDPCAAGVDQPSRQG